MGDWERTNVIIVGAGASAEFGLPTGNGLLGEISRIAKVGWDDNGKFFGDHKVRETFELLKQGSQPIAEAQFIRRNVPLAPSIDNFLHTHSTNEILTFVGKILIAKAILESERKSTLFYKRTDSDTIDFQRGLHARGPEPEVIPPAWSWLGELFRLLVAERNFDDFVQALGKITFVSFNYDRCVVHFLTHAAKQYFKLDNSNTNHTKDAIKVIHPYGSLGDLYNHSLEENTYGEDPSPRQLLKLASGIRTFTEGIESSNLDDEMHKAFENCQVAIFLGFGFLPLNMKLLFKDNEYEISRVIGTSKGQSGESKELIQRELREALLLGSGPARGNKLANSPLNAELSDTTCRSLIWQHWRYLQGR